MKHLKKYNKINESMFDPSTLEDILLDITDDGHTWDMDIKKSSYNLSSIVLYINFKSMPEWDKINPCILRIYQYMKTENYIPTGNTEDIIDEVENGTNPTEWIPGYYDNKHYYKGNKVDLTLQLSFKYRG